MKSTAATSAESTATATKSAASESARARRTHAGESVVAAHACGVARAPLPEDAAVIRPALEAVARLHRARTAPARKRIAAIKSAINCARTARKSRRYLAIPVRHT